MDAVRHSQTSAFQLTGAHHQPWPAVNHEQREAVIATGLGLVDLWEISPVRFEDNESHTEELIDRLFPGNPLLCCGRSKSDFATRSREEWQGKLSAMQLIVPNPMTARIGHTQDGKQSEHTLENTGARRFLVVEQDGGTIDEQPPYCCTWRNEHRSRSLSIAAANQFTVGLWQPGNRKKRCCNFMRYAVSLGADRATWTRSQFVRMPDGRRDNRQTRQTAYFFNPEVIK